MDSCWVINSAQPCPIGGNNSCCGFCLEPQASPFKPAWVAPSFKTAPTLKLHDHCYLCAHSLGNNEGSVRRRSSVHQEYLCKAHASLYDLRQWQLWTKPKLGCSLFRQYFLLSGQKRNSTLKLFQKCSKRFLFFKKRKLHQQQFSEQPIYRLYMIKIGRCPTTFWTLWQSWA